MWAAALNLLKLVPLKRWAYVVGFATVMTAVPLAVHHYNTLVTQRATLERERNDARAALAFSEEENDGLRASEKVANKLLVTRERQRTAAEREKEALNAQVDALKSSPDPDVSAWAETPVPRAVDDIVCKLATCDRSQDGARSGAGGADGTEQRSGVGAIPDQFGLTPIAGRFRVRAE